MGEPEDRGDSIDRIAAAALELFATKGYKSASLEEVAALAGFTKGAVYYHFKSKERLLLRVLQDIEARSIDKTSQVIEARGGTATEKLRTFVKCQTNWAARHPNDLAVVMLMSMESANQDSVIRDQIARFYEKISRLLERIIIAGKETGEFTTDQDTADIVMYLTAVHDGNMLLWYRGGRAPDIGQRLVKATLAGFERAVGAVVPEEASTK